jgi:exonuclease VII small subunit
MDLQEGIKALKSGDSQAAMSHLDAAKQAMVPGEAMNHFEQGVKALENGDLNGPIMRLTAVLLKT